MGDCMLVLMEQFNFLNQSPHTGGYASVNDQGLAMMHWRWTKLHGGK